MRDVNINSVRVLDRAIDILEVFTLDSATHSIDEIAQVARLPKATAYRLLYTMECRGLIHYDAKTMKYRLGLRLLKYASLVTSGLDIGREAQDVLIHLYETTKQTVLMAVLEGDDMVYIFRQETQEGLKVSSFVGQRRSPTFGVVGHVILAHIPADTLERILADPIPKLTPKTVTERDLLLERLKQIREQGYLIDIEETTIGVTGVAVPVFGSNGEFLCAVCVIGPAVQLQGDNLEFAKNMLVAAAQQISARMGFRSVR